MLTKRGRDLPTHAGEVAFPGGRLVDGEDPLGAALREASEEIALNPATAKVVAQLTPLSTGLSTALVHCFVATFPGPDGGGTGGPSGRALMARDGEVEEIFCPALDELLDDGVFAEELWPVSADGALVERAVPFFDLASYGAVVWGATGRMLYELLTRVTRSLATGP